MCCGVVARPAQSFKRFGPRSPGKIGA
jgi:hypothetical protein